MHFPRTYVAGFLLALPWVAAVRSQGQPEVPTFAVTGLRCPPPSSRDGTRKGSGFLAADWTAAGEQVLLTSLHVIDGCLGVRAHSIACVDLDVEHGEPVIIPTGRDLLVWPSHDLVAIPIPDGSPLSSHSQNVPAGRLEFGTRRPEEGEDIVILGSNAFNAFSACPKAFGQIQSYVKVAAQANLLAKELFATPEAMRGSLDPEAVVMIYTSHVGPGTSGAAVLGRRGENLVFGIHIAGYQGKAVGWSILVDGIDKLIGEPIRHRLGDTPWPEYDAPGLQQALYEHLTPQIDAAVFAYQQEQLKAYRQVTLLFKGYAHWAREVLIRYERYAGDAARLDRNAAAKMSWANREYEPYGQQILTGDADVLRAQLTTLWGPEMALRYQALLEQAVAVHKQAMFPTSEINQRIADAARTPKPKDRDRKIRALEADCRMLRQVYVPRLEATDQQVEQFVVRLEEGLRQLGLGDAIP